MKVSYRQLPEHPLGLAKPDLGPAKRPVSLWKWKFCVIAVLTPLFVLFTYSVYETLAVAHISGSLQLSSIPISAKADGFLRSLNVHVGQNVYRGQALARISTDEVSDQLQENQNHIRVVTEERHSAADSIQRLQIAVASDVRTLEIAAATAEKMHRLIAYGAATTFEAQHTDTDVNGLQKKLTTDQLALTEQEQEYAKLDASRTQADAHLYLSRDPKTYILTAPSNGQILSIVPLPRNRIEKGSEIITFLDTDNPLVVLDVPVTQMQALHPDMQVKFMLADGFVFLGRIMTTLHRSRSLETIEVEAKPIGKLPKHELVDGASLHTSILRIPALFRDMLI